MTLRITRFTLVTLLVSLMLCLSVTSSLAQGGDGPPWPGQAFRFEQLPGDTRRISVIDITQDSQGLLWFAGSDGLYRYDGYRTTVFRHDPTDPTTLSGNWVQEVLEDSHGDLWAGTRTGLSRFDPHTRRFTRYQHNPDDPRSLSENFAVSILVDSQDNVWIGTWGEGLNYLAAAERNKAAPGFIHYQHRPDNLHSLGDNIVTEIFEDSQGSLWLGTQRNGLQQFDRQRQSFRRFPHDDANPNSLSGNTVAAIFEDSQGLLWVGVEGGGVKKFNRRTLAFGHHRHDPDDPQTVSDAPVLAFAEDAQGDLWLATTDGGPNHLLPDDEAHSARFNGDVAKW